MEKKLEVKNLVLSFRTAAGRVRAIRDVSFTLNAGETLAIVGESGSGKSVTSKAILGISANNAIVEGGEIIYDGQDLLKISEDDFYKIRGDKISMIFQDPLSSLNPIMKIGKQLTEAMILKGKARQKASRIAFNSMLKRFEAAMIAANAEGDPQKAEEMKKLCKDFDTFEFKHTELEKEDNEARDAAVEVIPEIEDILFLIEKNALTDEKRVLSEAAKLSMKAIHTYVVADDDAATLSAEANGILSGMKNAIATKNYTDVARSLQTILAILKASLEKTAPNFFSMGYYLTFSGQPLPEMCVEELNEYLRKYLDEHFMFHFIKCAEAAIAKSADIHNQKKAEALVALREAIPVFEDPHCSHATYKSVSQKLYALVDASIDRLEIHKDSKAYIFHSSLESEINSYFKNIEKNSVEEKRYEKQKEKYEAYTRRKGAEPDWKLVPAAVVDLNLARANIVRIVRKLAEHYERVLARKETRNYHEETVAVIDFLKQNASGVVSTVTRSMARARALKLMEEVGIPEPRKRFKQYPFEFSGGMRQRIVIAIALAANPDILICDEPTTALDVTIQAQILELINKIKAERNLSIIFITHDLGVVANMADRIAVMYAGKIVEYGTSEDIFYHPAHPYTWALLSSMPDLDTNEKLEAIPGTPPNMIYPPKGDAFAERNKYAMRIDFEAQPPMFKISDSHYAATWLLHPDAPKVEPPKIITDRIARMNEKRGDTDHE